MIIITKVVATIYKSYISRGLDIPYFRTISNVMFLIFLHVVQVGILFNIPSKYIMPFNSANKILQWAQAAFYFGILILIFALIFPKMKLERQQITELSILKAKKILPLYIIGSILLLTVLLVRLGINKGTIHI